MTKILAMILAGALLATAVPSAQAEQAWFGYRTINVPANTDVRFTTPFNKDVEATRAVASASGTTGLPENYVPAVVRVGWLMA
ncbi:MAG: hypothetical protein WD294_11690, partial [Phycisphaeraceae bacterium]